MATLVALLSSLLLAAAALGCSDPGGDDSDARIDALFDDVPFGMLNRAQARRMVETAPADDRPFYLVSWIRYRERPADADGRLPGGAAREEGESRDSRILRILRDAGAEPIYVGDVERTIIARDGAAWHRVSVVLHPSRARFLALLERPDYRDAERHEAAAIERAIVLVAERTGPPVPDELRRVDLASVPFPPTAADPPMTVVHLLDFREHAEYADGRPTDLTGREAMALYEQRRAPQAFPLGIRPGLTLAVEGELVGDGRPWEEIRINNFPSRATFAQVTSEESLDQAGIEHRQAGLADTYAVIAAPALNEVGYLD
jgi:hypothetical protein